jgi:DNA-binding transcriptional ArsR family regulator
VFAGEQTGRTEISMIGPHTHRGDVLRATTEEEYDVLVVEGERTAGAVTERLESADETFTLTEAVVHTADDVDDRVTDTECIVCGPTLGANGRSAVLSAVGCRDICRCPVVVVCETAQACESLLGRDVVTDCIPGSQLGQSPTLACRISTHIESYRTRQALANADRAKLQILETLREAVSQQEVGTAFCRLLVNAYGSQCAWIRTTQGRGELTRQWAAGDTGYVSDVLDADTRATEPSIRAFQTGDVTAFAPIDGEDGGWQATAAEHGFGSAVGVPIAYQGTVFGALSVYDEMCSIPSGTRDFLSWFAQIVGYALRAAAWREAVLSAAPVAVEVELTDESVPLIDSLQGLPDETRLSVLSAIPREEAVLYVIELDEGPPDEALPRLERASEGVAVLTERPLRFEALFRQPTPETVLMTHGGQLVSVSVTPVAVVMTVAVRSEQRVEGLFDAFESEYDAVSIGAVWSRGTEEPTGYGDIAEALTLRQRQVLEFAYLNGYFDQPRRHNTTEIAKKLGLSRQTVSQHLRTAQRKLLRELLEPER